MKKSSNIYYTTTIILKKNVIEKVNLCGYDNTVR